MSARLGLMAYGLLLAAASVVVAETATVTSAGADTSAEATPAIFGDMAYGEYLAAECTGCHLVGATEATGRVPLITGWDPEAFVLVLQDYASGLREHGPMQMIAGRLGPEEMASLAVYFATLE